MVDTAYLGKEGGGGNGGQRENFPMRLVNVSGLKCAKKRNRSYPKKIFVQKILLSKLMDFNFFFQN